MSCPPLFRRIGFFVGQVNQKTKEHGSMPAGPEAKESPGFFDLVAFSSEVLIIFLHCGSVLTVERKSWTPTSSISDKFKDECEGTCTSTEGRSHTNLRREDFARSILP